MRKPTLYVGCSLNPATDEFIEQINELKAELKKHFDVLEFVGTTSGTSTDVYNWDIGHCVKNCDLFVAVCDYPSLGLGWELAVATQLNKQILVVAKRGASISRLVLGAAKVEDNIEYFEYDNLTEDVIDKLL